MGGIISSIVDYIILAAAFFVAITNIYKFFANSGKGIRNKVE
jgi:large-conductance mechanosensitive channel